MKDWTDADREQYYGPVGDWQDYDPKVGYRKHFCDVELHDGTVVRDCWPNAGSFNVLRSDMAGRRIPDDQVKCVRYYGAGE